MRLRIGQTLAIRVFQGISGGSLAVFALLGLLGAILGFADLPRLVQGRFVFDLILWILFLLAPTAGGVLGLLHASGVARRGTALSTVAFTMTLAFAAVVPLYSVLRLLPSLGLACAGGLFIGPFVLLCRGLSGTISLLAVNRPEDLVEVAPASEPPRTTMLEKRLRELERLHEQGLITAEQLKEAKAKMLSDDFTIRSFVSDRGSR